jgi:serine/threonine protein kinase
MPNKNWERVKEILDEVLRIAPSERQKFLSDADLSEEVRAEVESLLTFETEAENLMNLSAIEFSKDFFFEANSGNASIGRRIGVYQIIREIGYGGMGTVYLAERVDGKFEQKVAVKMLKQEFNIPRLRKSFQRECDIQSKLKHPNIANLLDSGTTREGLPYLIMEFVEGEEIDKFCEKNYLDLKKRLKVFNKVCDAVSFAHQNLIIHRDLKPSNILVTKDGTPKLLDFGISKVLNEEKAEENSLTIFTAFTPDYASPEQIRGEKVTTATDIYSLGVVLNKILTGKLPYNLKEKTNGDFLKTITDTQPTVPSSQKTNPNAVVRNLQLKGDIDNIILKALNKEPERRYKSVEQFSADIWRYIDGLPILARPATFSYRAFKFISRNQIAVISLFLVFLSLIAGITLATRQSLFAREQARITAESQKLAIAEAENSRIEQLKAEKITRFMSKIIGYANPKWYAEGAKFGKDARVIDVILDLGEKIDSEFVNEIDVAAELHHRFTDAIGNNAGNLRPEEQRARRLFHARRALELRKQFYGKKHELVAKDMVYLYWAGGVEVNERASFLMSAIQLMRETNPNNLNLPYMLEDYTARLILPEYEKDHETFRKAFLPSTDENKYAIAEKLLRESLPVFRLHYEGDNSAIFAAECKLSYALAMQKKWIDFDKHFAICKLGKDQLEQKKITASIFYKLAEDAFAENK